MKFVHVALIFGLAAAQQMERDQMRPDDYPMDQDYMADYGDE